jgi:hypothetical protein
MVVFISLSRTCLVAIHIIVALGAYTFDALCMIVRIALLHSAFVGRVHLGRMRRPHGTHDSEDAVLSPWQLAQTAAGAGRGTAFRYQPEGAVTGPDWQWHRCIMPLSDPRRACLGERPLGPSPGSHSSLNSLDVGAQQHCE